MAVIQATTTLASFGSFPADQPAALPRLRDVVARVATSLGAAVFAPAALFLTTMLVFNVHAAMLVALGWMLGVTFWRRMTRRPVSGLLLLTLGIATVKTCFALATGNTFVYFVQPIFVDAAVATVFLGSLWSAQPVVARLAPDFYPIDATLAAQPAMRGLFRRLTLLWGLVTVVKGSITLWLLVSLSTINFVLIKSGAIIGLTLVAVAATVALSVFVGRREGLLRPARPPG
jgi:uncharacterized membrane protein